MNKVLEFINISREFSLNNNALRVLSDVNFSINQKERVALIGPSGAGKTSFLHIAGLLELPTAGEVYINNNIIDWNSDKALSQHRLKDIGFIFQFNNLLDDFNATENVAIPFILSGIYITKFLIFSKKTSLHIVKIQKISGYILLVTGVLIVTGKLQTLGFYLLEWFPFLGKLG